MEKLQEEIDQKEWDDELDITHFYKRAGDYLYLVGEDWPTYDVIIPTIFLILFLEHYC